jgi:radical SAM protein with 4Fe4S-binding SPASM domain
MTLSNENRNLPAFRQNVKSFKVTDYPPQIYLGIQDGYCNLKCPCCFVHSIDKNVDKHNLQGTMPLEKVDGILEQVRDFKSLINPYRFSEPLINKEVRRYYSLIKEKGLPLLINTNGLLLDKDLAQFFVGIKMDAISFSIDAFTKETLMKVRGTDELDKIKKAVFTMLDARGDLPYPRIGVSYVLSETNQHEHDDFVKFWLEYVDVVRVNRQFDDSNRIRGIEVPEKRVPCYAIYNKMVIDFKGDVLLCTTDAFVKAKVGNVFENSVKDIWLGEKLTEFRHYHETGQFDKLPLCRDCNLWADYQLKESISDGILIRKSQSMAYYNRMDRLENWKVG